MNAQNISNDKLMWYVIIHLTFVLSAIVADHSTVSNLKNCLVG